MAGAASGATLPKLPVIQNVGVLPLQVEGDGDIAGRNLLETGFSGAVRAAHRFRVLSDDLVDGLWSDPQGRAELRGQFELQSFVSLTAAQRGDTVNLTARLMDGSLKTELLEMDQVTATWLAAADQGAVDERLQGLVFRLFNRIPVDVSVTSVNGAYLTLSGGADQGIEAGDRVDLVRTGIRSLHPANGTWLEFQRLPLGKAQVIDVKTYASVAKITDQTYENAIEVGDGARIGAIASRLKFKRLAANDTGFKDSGDEATIIVPPLYTGGAPAKPAAKPAAPPAGALAPAPGQGIATAAGGGQDAGAAPGAAPAAPGAEAGAPPAEQPPAAATPADQAQQQPPPPADDSPSFFEDAGKDLTSHRLLDRLDFYAGIYRWTFDGGDGTAPDKGSMPSDAGTGITAGGGVTRTLLYKIKTAFGGGILFGNASEGHFEGLDAYARAYWEEGGLDYGEGLLRGWKLGGLAEFTTIGTDHGRYGGGDWIRAGVFAGLLGTVHVGDGNTPYDWFFNFDLLPLDFGQVGYVDNQYRVQSAFGYRFELGAYMPITVQQISWGGALDYFTEDETLNNGRTPQLKDFSLKVLAKYQL